MYQKRSLHTRYQQQWRFLSKRLRQWVEDGSFAAFSKKKKSHLLKRLKHLFQQMLRFQTIGQLRKTLGVAALLLFGLGTAPALQAQVDFGPIQENPFGLVGVEGIDFQALADIDGDGDLDIISIGYEYTYGQLDIQRLLFRENQSMNNGTVPNFAEPADDFFGLVLPAPIGDSYVNPELADLDNDGDLDLLVGSYDYEAGGEVLYFENTGDAQNPAFGEPQLSPFGMNFANSFVVCPKLADMDGDGDLDLFSVYYEYDNQSGTAVNGFVFVENTGSASTPAFGTAQRDVFGLPMETPGIALFELGDIDNDGDIDILLGGVNQDEYSDEIPYTYYKNAGDAQNPAFGQGETNPFNLTPIVGGLLWPVLGDLDNDGDLDVLNSGSYNEKSYEVSWTYQENLLLTVGLEELSERNDELLVFPTVSSGQYSWQLESEAADDQLTLRVFTLDGRQILQQYSQQNLAGQSPLDISAYPNGSYQLQIISNDQVWSKLIVKQ